MIKLSTDLQKAVRADADMYKAYVEMDRIFRSTANAAMMAAQKVAVLEAEHAELKARLAHLENQRYEVPAPKTWSIT